MFTDDVVTILEAAGVGVGGSTIFVGSKAALPTPDSDSDVAFITIVATGGTSPEGTHNSIDGPAYVRPSAQIVARAMKLSLAEAKAQEAYNALFKVRNQFVNGTWWRQVMMKQDPYDLGEDDNARPRVAFNFDCVKRLSPATS